MDETIKYANCWEDIELILQSIQLPPSCNIISIASGGDNSFALLTTSPKKLYAIDSNIAQLHLCELKAAASSELSYDDFLNFILGSPHSRDIFETLKTIVSPSCKKYWENNLREIQGGIHQCGKFEKYFSFFRRFVMPLIHSKQEIRKLLAGKPDIEQCNYYHNQWNTLKWRYLFKLFFSKVMLANFGRTKEYLKHVDVPVAEFIYNRAAEHLIQTDCQNNYFLHYILTGQFKPSFPLYLRKENFPLIKRNLSSLTLKHGYVHKFIKKEENIDYCNFSNIFEYMDEKSFRDFHDIMSINLPEKATITYWNLMVDRVFSESFPQTFSTLNNTVSLKDKGFFYKRFIVEVKNG